MVLLRHLSVRHRAFKWWWLTLWVSFLFMVPSLKIRKCFKMSLVVLHEESLVGECSGVHVFILCEFCQILSLNFTQASLEMSFWRQLLLHPSAACEIKNEAGNWACSDLEVFTMCHSWLISWQYHSVLSRTEQIRIMDTSIFSEPLLEVGETMQKKRTLELCYRKQVIINVRTRTFLLEGFSWQF